MNHLILHFSIVKKGGLEVFSFNSGSPQEKLVDPISLSGFLTAIQLYSENMGVPVKQIHFNDFTLYFKAYGDFSMRLMVIETLGDKEFEGLFSQLSKELFPIISDKTRNFSQSENEIQQIVKPILSPYCFDISEEEELQDTISKSTISKIALVGLANAGKTSIKNIFFEKWTNEMARDTKPTVRIDFTLKFLDFINHKIAVHDFGGQVTYRHEYLQQEEIWQGISTLIFVVDLQDPSTFKIAKEYLSNIWEIVKRTNKTAPRLSIFLHKYDIATRNDLTNNIRDSFIQLDEFAKMATFYLTTIDDTSSNVALIKSLYFSLPDVILKRLLEEELLDYFETKILPKYSDFSDGDSFDDVFRISRINLIKSTKIHGMSIGYLLQKSWMDALMGDWTPKPRALTSKSLRVERKSNALYITIPNWTDEDIPKELTTTLLDSMLIGILKTFQLPEPVKIEETDYTTTWQVRF